MSQLGYYTLTLKTSRMYGLSSITNKAAPRMKYVLAKITTKKVMQEFWSGKEKECHTLSTGDKTIPVLVDESLATMTIVRKVENAPGSLLMGYNATINICLLRLHDDEVLQVKLTLLPPPSLLLTSTPTNPYLKWWRRWKALFIIVTSPRSSSRWPSRAGSTMTLFYISSDRTSSHPDQLSTAEDTTPTVEDLRNMSQSVIHKIWKNMFDQDALEIFLLQ